MEKHTNENVETNGAHEETNGAHLPTIDTSGLMPESDPLVRSLRRTAELVQRVESESVEQLGKYRVARAISSSAQASTFQGFDAELERDVLLKMYNCRSNVSDKELAIKEGRLLALIQSPFVASCFGLEWYAEKPVLVLEYVKGTTLTEYRLNHEPDWSELEQLFLKIATGLCAIHEKGVVHKDVKSSNIMLDAEMCPRIIDFGLSFRSETENTVPGSGTSAYLAPEIARGETTADERSDIFGLGAVLFEMLYGTPPFLGDDSQESLALAREGIVTFPEIDRPKHLVELCSWCLQQEPNERPTCQQVLRQLTNTGKERGQWIPLAVMGFLVCAAMFLVLQLQKNDANNPALADGTTRIPVVNDNPAVLDDSILAESLDDSNVGKLASRSNPPEVVSARLVRSAPDSNGYYLVEGSRPTSIRFEASRACFFTIHHMFLNDGGEVQSKRIYPPDSAYEQYEVGVPINCLLQQSLGNSKIGNSIIVVSVTSHFKDEPASTILGDQKKWAEKVVIPVRYTETILSSAELAQWRLQAKNKWKSIENLIAAENFAEAIDEIREFQDSNTSMLRSLIPNKLDPESYRAIFPDIERSMDCFNAQSGIYKAQKDFDAQAATFREASNFLNDFAPRDPRVDLYRILGEQTTLVSQLEQNEVEAIQLAMRSSNLNFDELKKLRVKIESQLGKDNIYSREIHIRQALEIEQQRRPQPVRTQFAEALRITDVLFGKHPEYASVLIKYADFELRNAGFRGKSAANYQNAWKLLDEAIRIFERQDYRLPYAEQYLRAQMKLGFVGLRLGQKTIDKASDETHLERSQNVLENAIAFYDLAELDNSALLGNIHENLAQACYHRLVPVKDAQSQFLLAIKSQEKATRLYREQGESSTDFLRATIWLCAMKVDGASKVGNMELCEEAVFELDTCLRNLKVTDSLTLTFKARILNVKAQALALLKRIDEAKAAVLELNRLAGTTNDPEIHAMLEFRYNEIRKYEPSFLLPKREPESWDQ